MGASRRMSHVHRGALAAALLSAACSTVLGIDDPPPLEPCNGGCGGSIAGASPAAGNAGLEETAGTSGKAQVPGDGGAAGGSEVGGASGGDEAGGSAGKASGGGGGAGKGEGGAGGGSDDAGGSGGAAECSPTQVRCVGYRPQSCPGGTWQDSGPECEGFCRNGACDSAPSCGANSLTTPCVGNSDCCSTILVPGGAYNMGQGDDEDPDLIYPRRVSDFYLDRFEVTVGRFAAFMTAYSLPAEGAGAHPKLPDTGWHKSWEALTDDSDETLKVVPPTSAKAIAQMTDSCGSAATWSTADTTLPINCVNWYTAFAFCVFDHGRLPTEDEWNYAAAHGADERPYPWSPSSSNTDIDLTYAAYDDFVAPKLSAPKPVGSYILGRGGFYRFLNQGHDDLAGNLNEWALDRYVDEPLVSCATDCWTPWSADDNERVNRGGGFRSSSSALRTGVRASAPATARSSRTGFRCARDIQTPTPQ